MFDYSAPDQLLANRVILVTGASRGIGQAAAIAYAKAGAKLIITSRDSKALLNTATNVESLTGERPMSISLDLESTDQSTYQQIAKAVHQHYGRLDGLLNNAGILGPRASIADYDPTTWQRVVQVNINGQFLLTQALLPLLEQSQDAKVIFTSSGVGRHGRANWGAYAVSKFATEGLTQVLANEMSENASISVNAINPGATRTSMRANAYPDENPEILPTAEAIMPVYLYLMGPDSEGINGQSLNAQ